MATPAVSALPRNDDPDHATRQDPWGRPIRLTRCGPSYFARRRTAKRSVDLFGANAMVLKNGLSRMRGDSHVRFLGGGGAVMRCCYPTSGWTAKRG